MAITKEQRNIFNEHLKDFTNYIEELKKEAILYKSQMKKSKGIEPYYQIAIVLNSVRFINTCIQINELSVQTLDIKNQNYLDHARKEAYSIFFNMEKVVGADYELGLDENRAQLDAITEFTPKQRLHFLKALKDTITKLVEAYGSNSKWKWSFPEMHFKLAVLSMKLLDFLAYGKEYDLKNPNYRIRREHFDLIIELCNFAAYEYWNKFDQSTHDVNDMKKSRDMQDIKRKIFQITGENQEDLIKTKNLIESLSQKIDALEDAKTSKKSTAQSKKK